MKTRRLCAALSFIIMLAAIGAASVGALLSETETSERENRALAEFPSPNAKSYFSGDFFRDFDSYVADHVPFRNSLLDLSERLRDLGELEQEAKIVTVKADAGVAAGDGDAVPIEEREHDAIVLKDRILQVYLYDEELCGRYAEAVNGFAAKLPDSIRLYSMLIPLRIEFEDDEYSGLSDSQRDAISRVYGAYSERVARVDAYSQIQKHSGEYVYFRTDHHWTALGAYYGMRAFAEAAGFIPLDITDYEEGELPGFLGYLYRMNPAESIAANPDTISYYRRPGVSNREKIFFYDETAGEGGPLSFFERDTIDASPDEPGHGAVFTGGDYPLVIAEGDMPGGRVLALIRDSYGSTLIPWLTPYFERVIAIDPRLYREDLGDTLSAYGVTDALILNCTMMTMAEAYISKLSEAQSNL